MYANALYATHTDFGCSQAFESVIPSERTAVSLKIMDGSIRAVAPSHPGAVVLHIGDLSFSTNIVGSSADVAFQLSTPALAVLALDDLSSVNEVNHSSSGVNFWKVRSMVV